MTYSWFNNVVKAGLAADIRGNIWRYHPQSPDQFFAEYLPANYLANLERAEEIGWKKAVEIGLPELSADVADYTRDYFFEPYRASFVDELGIGPGAKVLDLACGWGFASQRCLELGANVVGAEIAMKRLAFCGTRFRQQGFGERFVGVEMDVNRAFPFAAGSFDAVIVSGLLEWVACSTMGDPRKIQNEFMARVVEVLKPGGRLYLAIENRYWGDYFKGAEDLHTLRPWVSILPRKVARAYSILRWGEDYRAYCHSLPEYLSMLAGLGFGSTEVLYPEPDYVRPKKVTALIKGYELEGSGGHIGNEVYARCADGTAGRFGRSFMFIARKRGTDMAMRMAA